MIWLKKNLFDTTKDSIVTLILGLSFLALIYISIKYVVWDADWTIAQVNLRPILIGRYPEEEEYRLVMFFISVAVAFGGIAGVLEAKSKASERKVDTQLELFKSYPQRFGLLAVLGVVLAWAGGTSGPWFLLGGVIVAAIFSKLLFAKVGAMVSSNLFFKWMPVALFIQTLVFLYLVGGGVDSFDDLGGFFLDVVIAVLAVLACFPVGILLALGRRSGMKLVSLMCVGLIEVVRGGPLFVWLFLGGQLLPFLLPADSEVSDVTIAFMTFTIFTGAYMAEIIRGGLQSIPKGQTEAAQALGLKPFNQIRLIVLPQALRNVIPAQIGQLISLFKDVVLAGIALGLFEALRVANGAVLQNIFRGDRPVLESLLFVGVLFWIFAYTTSRESQRFEKKLGIG